MPLVETLTLLASLGSALQAIRLPRGDDKPEGKQETSTALLLSYEYVKSSQEWAVRADDTVNGRLQTLLLVSSVTVAAVLVATAGFVEGASAGSPLLIAGLLLLGVIALATVITRTLGRPALISIENVTARETAFAEWDFLKDTLALASRYERSNRRVIVIKSAVLDLVCVCFAAQTVLIGLWALTA